MGLFKDLLGDLAKDYLKERGIQGAVSDIKGGLKGIFGSDDDSGEITWDDMFNYVKECIEEERFSDAEDALVDYYNAYENGEPDFAYFALRSEISFQYYSQLPIDSDQNNVIEAEIEDFLDGMKNLADNKDNRQHYRDCLKDYQETKEARKKELKKIRVNQPNNDSASKEKEYFEEFKACIENDGIISDRERRLLNRLRDSLGISEKRAIELENMYNPSAMSTNEMEYIKEVKAVLEDGVITERERRLLDRLAKSLDITPERAKEIEKTIKC